MMRRPPRSTRTVTLFPYTPLFRSVQHVADAVEGGFEADVVGAPLPLVGVAGELVVGARSEEHTYELQSLMRISYAVFCLTKKRRCRRRKRTDVTTTVTQSNKLLPLLLTTPYSSNTRRNNNN